MNIELFFDHEIRFVEDPSGKYEFGIVASDLAKALEVTLASDLVKAIDDDYKGMDKVKTNGGIQSMTVIWEPGIRQVLAKSRKPKAKYIAQELGINLDILTPCIEVSTISVISNAFSHLSPIDQFFISGYRIDLYFPEQRIAVECDEKHHKNNQQKKYDKKRQDVITKLLGCQWVRYNPEEQGFCVGNVINALINKIY